MVFRSEVPPQTWSSSSKIAESTRMKTPSSRVLISDHHCFKHPSGNVFIPLSASVEKVVPPLGFPPSKPMVADPPVTPLGFGQVSNFFCARWPLDPALCNAMCIHSINHLCLGGPLYFASLNLPHLLVCLLPLFILQFCPLFTQSLCHWEYHLCRALCSLLYR